jgi:hypothetical protein
MIVVVIAVVIVMMLDHNDLVMMIVVTVVMLDHDDLVMPIPIAVMVAVADADGDALLGHHHGLVACRGPGQRRGAQDGKRACD